MTSLDLLHPDQDGQHDGVAPLFAHPLPFLHLQAGLPSAQQKYFKRKHLEIMIYIFEEILQNLFAPAVAVPTL